MPADPHWLPFLRAFINELLVRYANLNQFLERVRREAGDQSQTLLEEFSKKLNRRVIKLLKDVDKLYDLPVDDGEVDEIFVLIAFDNLKQESEDFQTLHRTLRWFSEPWPEAELFQFLHRVFKEKELDSKFRGLNPNIVFHDVFNFLTYDIGYMTHSDTRLGLDAWALPKSESANPLLWTVLVHEVAHDIYEPKRPRITELEKPPGEISSPKKKIYNYLSEHLGSFPPLENSEKESHYLQLLELWSTELYADLFSLRVLGPAYLYALMYFSIFFFTNDLRKTSPTGKGGEVLGSRDENEIEHFHPSPKDRIYLLLEEMSSLGHIELDAHNKSLETLRSLFYARLELDHRDSNYEHDERFDLPRESQRRLWQVIKEIQTEELPQEIGLHNRDIQNAASLYERLKADELACSLPISENKDKLKAYIEEKESSVTRAERRDALSQLDERPARMIDIINAGWMNKAHDKYWKYPISKLDGLRNPELDWAQALDKLIEQSRQLQKSIQVALIISPLLLDLHQNQTRS
ncbi:MAG TPA: hypothetical protein VD861_12680 [Pyrinomonadaceae bacterium]|nr:hypothetical protein [Pyrinomonadaceae bacterium]